MTLGQGQRVAIVTGSCIDHDAISNIVAFQHDTMTAAGFDVRIFAQHVDRTGHSQAFEVHDPWALISDHWFAGARLVIYHFGIGYPLFSSLAADHPTAARVVHFHNVTPPSLLDGPAREAAAEGLLQLAVAEHADVIWGASAFNISTLLELTDVPLERCRVLEPGLWFEPEVTARSPRPPAAPLRILSVGRFVRSKGLTDLLDAVDLLDSDTRDQVSISLAGSSAHSDPTHLAEVRSHVEAAGGQVVLDLPSRDLAELFTSCDIFVSASHHEGYCVPVVEALAAGCRVIVSDAGALPDTVGSCGTVVPVGNPAALAAAISEEVAALRALHADSDDVASETEQQRIDRVRVRLGHLGPSAGARTLLHEVREVLALPRRNSTLDLKGAAPSDARRYAQRQRRLLERLACPRCGGQLQLRHQSVSDDAVESGVLWCDAHGKVGVISGFTPSFLDRETSRFDIEGSQVLTSLDLRREVTFLGSWKELDGTASCGGRLDDALVFDSVGGVARLELLGHPDGGGVRVLAEHSEPIEVCLNRPSHEPIEVALPDLGPERRRVHLVPLAEHPGGPAATGDITVTRIVTGRGGRGSGTPSLEPENRGNPYPDRFRQLVSEMPPDAMILDCGGGDRRYGDDRVFNLEYLPFELPDLFGDGLCLPFADDSFDLIQSQAVLEHVPDPQRAVDEMVRALKPGGLIYIEIAFMQPLHAVPSHYMNVTPHGIAHLCRELEVLEQGTFGGLEYTFEWFSQLVTASERIGPDRVSEVLAALRDLDRTLSEAELSQFASAVYLLGRKPQG